MIELKISGSFTHFKDVENSSESTSLNIGSQLVSDRFFSDFPPTYDDIDHAINFTEELLAKIQHLYDAESVLYTSDIMSKEIARLAFNTSRERSLISLSRIELEHVFNRLADIVKGLPPAQDVLPHNNEFAAYLLILREVMHHLQFDRILVEEDEK